MKVCKQSIQGAPDNKCKTCISNRESTLLVLPFGSLVSRNGCLQVGIGSLEHKQDCRHHHGKSEETCEGTAFFPARLLERKNLFFTPGDICVLTRNLFLVRLFDV